MSFHATAAIVSVGDELTLGQTLDTNSRWLSLRLGEIGIVVREHVTVADVVDEQRRAMQRLAESVDLIVCTGGLGPTADDLTREALALAMDDSLIEDPVALSAIEAWFIGRGHSMPPLNRVQALRPARAVCLPNLNGTAPGLHGAISRGDRLCDVMCVPGPPVEMTQMFETAVVPRLRPDPLRIVKTRALHCFGIGESDLATRLGDLMDRRSEVLVGTTASDGVVSVRLRLEAVGLDHDEAMRRMHQTEMAVRAAAGHYIFGTDDDTLAAAVVRLLQERAQSVCTVESCTGGGLGAMLTDVPGASDVFPGGLITYANAIKMQLANVPAEKFAPGGPGAVSGETVAAMAVGGLALLKATHCLAVTGIAGPHGGSKEKPVGTVWIARASDDGTVDARRFQMGKDRINIRVWSARTALAMVRLKIIGQEQLRLLRQVE